MKNTFKIGTSVTFNRPSSNNDGKTGVVISHRDKTTSPFGVKLEGKEDTVWCAGKFLTVNETVIMTVDGFNIGDTVTNIGRGSKAGRTGTVKKLRDAVTNVGVEYVEGVTTWCKHTNLVVSTTNASLFIVGHSVEYINPDSKRYGSVGTVAKFRDDGRVGVNFKPNRITWCDEENLHFASDSFDSSDDFSDDWDSNFDDDSADSVVINFKGINITVSKDCKVSITQEGVSVN